MKKILCFTIIYFLAITCFFGVDVRASCDDYSCFVEIMMSSGKLLENFTEKEIEDYTNKIIEENQPLNGFSFHLINDSVQATYISQTLYNFNNKGNTNLDYEVNITMETANKISYKFSESLAASGSQNKQFKSEVSSKTSYDYSSATEESKKVTEKVKITVEAGSRCVIYLIGDLCISNGFILYGAGVMVFKIEAFEICIIQSQYPKIEKEKI